MILPSSHPAAGSRRLPSWGKSNPHRPFTAGMPKPPQPMKPATFTPRPGVTPMPSNRPPAAPTTPQTPGGFQSTPFPHDMPMWQMLLLHKQMENQAFSGGSPIFNWSELQQQPQMQQPNVQQPQWGPQVSVGQGELDWAMQQNPQNPSAALMGRFGPGPAPYMPGLGSAGVKHPTGSLMQMLGIRE